MPESSFLSRNNEGIAALANRVLMPPCCGRMEECAAGCNMGPTSQQKWDAAIELAKRVLVASETKLKRAFEETATAFLIERPEGTFSEIVRAPLTDGTFLDEGDAAYPLFKELYTQEQLDEAKRRADELHKGLRIE